MQKIAFIAFPFKNTEWDSRNVGSLLFSGMVGCARAGTRALPSPRMQASQARWVRGCAKDSRKPAARRAGGFLSRRNDSIDPMTPGLDLKALRSRGARASCSPPRQSRGIAPVTSLVSGCPPPAPSQRGGCPPSVLHALHQVLALHCRLNPLKNAAFAGCLPPTAVAARARGARARGERQI